MEKSNKKGVRKSVGSIKKRATVAFSPVQFHKDDGGDKHILYYEPETLFNFGFISPKGSVMSWGMAFRTLVMCGIGTFVSQFRCAAVPTHYSFCFPILANAEGLIFASLVTFLLGLFVSTTFTRWWTIREKIGVFMNSAAVLTMLLKNFVTEGPEEHELLHKVKRYMHLGHAMVYKYANANKDFSDLQKYSLATKEEIKIFEKYKDENLPAMVYGWAMRGLGVLCNAGKITPWASAVAAITAVQNAFNATHDLDALLKSQMPYAYLHLLTITTKIHLAFVVFYAGGIIASGITGDQWNRIVFGYVVIITNYLIYEGLLIIHNVLVNPLGSDAGDFPTNLYVSTVYGLSAAMEHPPPIEEPKEITPSSANANEPISSAPSAPSPSDPTKL